MNIDKILEKKINRDKGLKIEIPDKKPVKKSGIKKIIMVALLLVVILGPIGFVGMIAMNLTYDTSSLTTDYNPKVSSRIYDVNGDKIANIFEGRHRFYASFDEIPPRMVEALLAIEDTSFFEHGGINYDAIMRAVIKDIKAMAMVEGASTLTQQLVKNTLLTREKKISRKIKELILSYKIEAELTKTEILERYFNEIYLGHSYYGVKTAADGYFHKELKDLTLKEMAILVGLPKAPSYYAPTKNYDISLGRANRVIERLYALSWIDQESYEKALQEKPVVYDDTLTENKAPYVVAEVVRRLNGEYPDLKTGGYKVYTTIDLKMQQAAREALTYGYEQAKIRLAAENEREEGRKGYIAYADQNLSKFNGAIISVDPKLGEIRAMVGGIDYTKSSFNRATLAYRQPGSAFKPFLYQVALDFGYSGATQLIDISRTYDFETDQDQDSNETRRWKPQNYENNFKGLISLREALVHSRNLATINLVTDIGINTIRSKLKQRYEIEDLPNDLSLSLGSITLTPERFAEYFTSFANGGQLSDLRLISSVEQGGETLWEHPEQVVKRVTEERQAFLMTTMLRDIVQRGTGARARVPGIELAGKTGTTNDSIDTWFVGYSPSIETVVWFGNDDNSPLWSREQGGWTAAPSFGYYYKELIKIYPQMPRKFEKPDGVIEVTVDGKNKEYFTDISKPPKTEVKAEADEELLF
ncbi:MAG: PBP1A family penicillin-binding protein [Helicobacteraceae bacterium]|jgi:penicillin-binding protein 1A|nr:PBP1A family penicillin-binding protein [Helicobacteraceae bacterium]